MLVGATVAAGAGGRMLTLHRSGGRGKVGKSHPSSIRAHSLQQGSSQNLLILLKCYLPAGDQVFRPVSLWAPFTFRS